MDSSQNNPLANFFRQPSIYIKLPSDGRWWPTGSLEMPVNREIPVFSMTTKDEIILKTPDALLNGQGVVEVIQSCCPNIKDAWNMPSIDVDTVLIAIRMATYGNKMGFESKCSACNEENEHDVELSSLIGGIECPDYSETIPFKGLKIKLHPQPYFSMNRVNSVSFEEQRLANILAVSDVDPDVKSHKLAESMKRLVELNTESVTESTEYIEINGDQRVTDKVHIKEFYALADAAVVKSVQDKLSDISSQAKLRPIALQCNDCKAAYSAELTFDYANFFGNGS